ncbi:hypothetical protein MF271_21190 (plasmid) [Deinococcus sp. KNUC1210]|uniref:delta-60 repeat domain-containing protein n=1 Tax=Deinococcus sp. KNUC1210 TaxID=2917691 RepID=UPI001EEFB698|nr:delta-60 repeat domain-containing protein [Deinococcus sp. KNUC1210]ULH17568.1 hypothetical protein MF271_21190 [Deinococcus sp. KNUC1210]
MKRTLIISGLLLTGTLVACSGSGAAQPDLTIRTIELTPGTADITVGQSKTLTATAKNAQGQALNGISFVWKSSAETVAKVAGGVVTGMGVGNTSITASVGNVISTAAALTVRQPQSSSFDLSLSQDRLPVITGTSARLTVTLKRNSGFSGAVNVTLSGLPAGATGAPISIPEGQTSAEVTVSAAANAAHSQPTAVTLTGTATGTASVSKTLTVTVRGPAGSLDTTFGTGGIAVTPVGAGEDVPSAVTTQPDGKLIVVGRTSGTHADDFAVVRYTRDGSLDQSFGNGGRVLIDFAGSTDIARAVALQSDGRILVAGGVTTGNAERFGLARLNTDGSLDNGFGTGGKVTTAFSGSSADRPLAVVVQPNGAVVVGGQATFASNATGIDFALARYTPSGTLDASFGTGGQVTTALASQNGSDSVHALALQQGKIIAVGGEGDFAAARYTPSGTLDNTFGTGGKVSGLFAGTIGVANAVQLDSQNRLVLAGQSQNDTAVVRLTENGALDNTFGTGGKKIIAISAGNWDAATGLAIQTDGKVVLGGWVYEGGSSSGNFAVTRLNNLGQLDDSFGQGGTTITPVAPGTKDDQAQALTLQPDERIPATRIVAVGLRNDSNQDFALTRYWP